MCAPFSLIPHFFPGLVTRSPGTAASLDTASSCSSVRCAPSSCRTFISFDSATFSACHSHSCHGCPLLAVCGSPETTTRVVRHSPVGERRSRGAAERTVGHGSRGSEQSCAPLSHQTILLAEHLVKCWLHIHTSSLFESNGWSAAFPPRTFAIAIA